MSTAHRYRLPFSTRHAFALAGDLALRRDLLHSLIVPLLLRAPYIVALAMLPSPKGSDQPMLVVAISTVALIGDFLSLLVVGAMLRFRARSVYNRPPGSAPEPVMESYAHGLKRVPWLIVTEVVRNLSLVFAAFFFLIPALFLGYRLAFATEAVVLVEPHTAGSFQRSFKLTDGRFERWLEMIAASVAIVFGSIFLVAALSIAWPAPGFVAWVAVTRLLITAVTPIIQYAWTFFYLRLEESAAEAPGIEVGPAYATATPAVAPAWPAENGPHLALVQPVEPPAPEEPTGA